MDPARTKVVILAGGLGTRLAEETDIRPKPMVEIGGRPILWHIMKAFSHFGFKDFYIALGYKGDYIKRYFVDYTNLQGSMTVDLGSGEVVRRHAPDEDWQVHLIETGYATNTGGRVRRLEPYLKEGPFIVTYGDGVADIDVKALTEFHERTNTIATVSAVRPPARFGGILFDGDLVRNFTEKPQVGEGWINGGFMVLEPAVFDYLDGDDTSLEAHALERLAGERQLSAYRHEGFWQCMDTLRDKQLLERYWANNDAPWQFWVR